MDITTVCVIGGSGFVGRHICHLLAARGYRVRVPTRDREQAKQLTLLPTVDVVNTNVHDPQQLADVMRGTEAVISLVGVLHDGRGDGSFQRAHVGLAGKVVEACRTNGVRRLLHMSALAADVHGPSAYLRSKGEAETVVIGSGLDVTVFRPSVIFGRDDSFLNLFAKLLGMPWPLMPVFPLGSPNARFQPVFVEDVSTAFVHSLEDFDTFGRRYDLCGPKIYTLRELVEFVGAATGHRKPVIGLNDTLSYWQALLMEWLPVKIMTRDNYYSMKVESVCSCVFPFGIRPAALEAIAPAWLGEEVFSRRRYQRFRNYARR